MERDRLAGEYTSRKYIIYLLVFIKRTKIFILIRGRTFLIKPPMFHICFATEAVTTKQNTEYIYNPKEGGRPKEYTKWDAQLSGRSTYIFRAWPAMGPDFFIFMQFSRKIGRIISWRPRLGLVPPQWEILDLPLSTELVLFIDEQLLFSQGLTEILSPVE